MSRLLSAKVACVLAAAAFVVVFRLHAGDSQNAQVAAAATPLSAARASALESDTKRAAARPPAKLAVVAALPSLHREPHAKVVARHKREAAERRARAHRRKVEAAHRRAARKRDARAAAAAAAAARRRAAAKPATPAPTPAPVVTPAPTPVYHPPVYIP